MAESKALGLGQLAAGAAAALVVVVGGGVWWSTQRPDALVDVATSAEVAAPAANEIAAAAGPATEPAAEPVLEPAGTATTEPATTEPAATEPAATEPAATESAATESATTEPATTEPATTESATTEPATTEPAATEPAATAAVAADPAAAAMKPPGFDVVRVDPDGNVLIAGQAAAGSAVSVRIDQAEVFSTAADAQGKFVAMFAVPAAEVPRTVTLVMRMESGTEIAGADSVILAPTAAKPVVIAEAAEPVAVEPATVEPATVEPATPEPATPEPAITELAATEPAATEPAATETATQTADPVAMAEPAAPAVLLADETGLKVLQPAGDAIAQNVVIDTISYDRNGSVVLAGRGAGDSALQIYLDNQALATIAIAADGSWSTPLPAIQPGIYTLRVDQIDAAGKVTSRYETPFKREDPAALAGLGAEPAPAETVVAEVAPEPASETVAEPVAEAVAEPAAEPAADEVASEPAAEPAVTEPVAEPAAEPAVTEPVAEPAAELAVTEPVAEPAAPLPATEPAAIEPAPEPAAEPVAPEPAATETAVANAAEPAPAPDAAAAPVAPEPVATAETAAEPEPGATEPLVTAGAADVAQPAAEPAPETVVEGARVTIVTVQPGFTLWQIASEAYGEGVMYVQVWDANKDKIRNPDLIYPGQVFLVPEPPTTGGN